MKYFCLGFERVESQKFGQFCRLLLRRSDSLGRHGVSVGRCPHGRRHGDDDEGASNRGRLQRGTHGNIVKRISETQTQFLRFKSCTYPYSAILSGPGSLHMGAS